MTSPSGAESDSSTFTNYVNISLSINKLDETNYDLWASNWKLWLKDQIMLTILLKRHLE